MNLLTKFFSQDNFTIKVAGWMAKVSAFITMLISVHLIPAEVQSVVGIVAAALLVIATVVQRYTVFTWGLVVAAGYSLLQYLMTVEDFSPTWKNVFAAAAFGIALFSGFSTQEPTDTKTPAVEVPTVPNPDVPVSPATGPAA